MDAFLSNLPAQFLLVHLSISNILLGKLYICYNTGVYLYIAPRAGRDIPAYLTLAEQAGDMQYIAPTVGREIYLIHIRCYSL